MTLFAVVIFYVTLLPDNQFSVSTKPVGLYHTHKTCKDLVELMNPGLPKGQEAVCLRTEKP